VFLQVQFQIICALQLWSLVQSIIADPGQVPLYWVRPSLPLHYQGDCRASILKKVRKDVENTACFVIYSSLNDAIIALLAGDAY
jgi:hypothetical protein